MVQRTPPLYEHAQVTEANRTFGHVVFEGITTCSLLTACFQLLRLLLFWTQKLARLYSALSFTIDPHVDRSCIRN
jgi:hypothetical protein